MRQSLLILVLGLVVMPIGGWADNSTDFEIQDDVTVLGEEGTLNDADAEFEGEVAVQRDIYQHAGQFAGPFAGFGRIENLLTYSQEFDNPAWTRTDATLAGEKSAPDQSNTAYQLTNSGGSGGSISQSVSGSGSTEYAFSVWLKAGDSTSATIEISDDGSTPASNQYAITSLPDKWKRYEVSFTSSSDASNITVKVINNGADTTSIYIWGAQLEQADHSGVYVKTEGSAVSERFGLGVNGQAYVEDDVIVGDGANFDNSSSEADLYVKGNLEVDGSVWLGSTTIDGTIDMGSHNIVNLADPVNAQDGATKNYVDSQVTGAVSGTENYIAKFTGAGSVGDSIIYEDSSGSPTKIGIGTSSPGAVLDVNGDVKVGTDLVIGNDASIGGGLSVSGATSLSSTLDVTGNTTIGGDLAVNGGDITSSASALNITPADGGSVNITDGTNTLMSISDVGTVGDMSLTGSANISGDTTIGGNLTANGDTVLGNESGDLLTVHGRISQVDTGYSVFIGEGAGASDDLSDNKNVFVGYQAGNSNTSGYYNTAMGYQALYSNTTGSNNIGLGYGAGDNITGGSSNIIIGMVDADSSTADSQLNIGNTIKGSVQTGFDAVEYYDGTSFTDDTDEAKQTGGLAYTVLGDGTDDYFYVGNGSRKFSQIYFDIATSGEGVTLEAEYYNGSSWTSLSIDSDGTSNLTQDGLITFTMPSDWAQTNVDGKNYYWIRLKSGSSVTTAPTAYLTVSTGDERLRVYSNESDSVPALMVDIGKHVGINTSDATVGLQVGSGTIDNVSGTTDAYIAGNLEVDGTIYGSVAGSSITDDSLDWDKFADSMILDATTRIDMDSYSADFEFDSTDHTLYIDSVNNRIGIGTTSPEEKLTISGGNISLTTADSIITGVAGLTLQETGDTYGTVKLHLQNRAGVNGAMFEQAGTVDLVDFVFKSLSNQRNIRFEDRGDHIFAGDPEFQIGVPDDPTLLIGDSVSAFRKGNVGIGTTNPQNKLHILGTDNGIRLGYDETKYALLRADASGNLLISNNGSADSISITSSGNSSLQASSTTTSRLILKSDTDDNAAGSDFSYITLAGGTTNLYSWYMGIDSQEATSSVNYLYFGSDSGSLGDPSGNRSFSFSSQGDFWQRLDYGGFIMGSIDEDVIDDMEDISDWTSSDTTNTGVSLSSDPVIRGQGAMEITTSSGNSSGDTVTKSFASSQDFRSVDKIGFWIRATGTGQIISIELNDDSASTDPHHDITIERANQWQYEEWDISGIASEDRDVISAVKFIIDNDTGSPTVYVDELRKYNSSTRGFEVYTDTGANTVLFSNGKIIIPSGVEIVSGGSFTLQGSARHQKIVRLSPEYPNVIFQADGSDNAGTLESGVELPATSDYVYSYYKWSTTQTAQQDYDIYVRWSVPSDFDGFPSGIDNALVVDIATATTNSSDNAVDVYLYKDGSATTLNSSDLDNVSTTAGGWNTDQENNAVIKFASSDSVLSSLSSGDVLVIRMKVKANDTNSGWAKVGTITVRYLSKW